jgi:hypothetical protein
MVSFTGGKTKRNNVEETNAKPQEREENAYANELAEQVVALEEGIASISVVEEDPETDRQTDKENI